MKYLQKSLQLNSIAVNKLIFFCVQSTVNITFYQSFVLSVLYNDSFFIYYVRLRMSLLFHIFEPLWNLKFMKVKSQKYITAYVIWCIRLLKIYRNVSLHVSKWTQCYISFWILLISKDTLLVWLEVIFQGVMNVL